MPNFGAILKVFGPRVLGSILAGVATWIGIKTGGAVQIDPEAAAATVTGIFLSYAAAHKGTSAKVNKGDAATGRLVDKENAVNDQLKRTEDPNGI